jgi:putative Holliday junction resolvase
VTTLRGRRIAFDYGDARIGVAISDPDGILATPLPYIANKKSLTNSLQELFAQYQPIQCFVGQPLTLKGDPSITSEKVEIFVQLLHTITDAPIAYIDERFSTYQAASRLKESGLDSRQTREFVDSMAAVAILETGLASK